MRELSDTFLAIRCTAQRAGMEALIAVEIEYRGFAIVTYASPELHRVVGFTLGLTELDHPELMTVGGSADDVYAFLAHLASQVMDHDQVFEQGRQSTSIYRSLQFRQAPDDVAKLDIVESIYGDMDIPFLSCDEPFDFAIMAA